MTEQNIFEEIEQDLENQKYAELWNKYGAYVVGLALAIVVVTAGITSWHSWQAQKNQAATANLFSAINQPDNEPAKEMASLEAFALNDKDSTHTVLAQLGAARMAAKANNMDRAIQIYDHVAKDQTADPAFRQFADLMSVRAQLDTGDVATLQERLKPMLVTTSPWHFSAAEYEGYLALKAGEKDSAREIFKALAEDPKTPQSMSARATDIMRYISE